MRAATEGTSVRCEDLSSSGRIVRAVPIESIPGVLSANIKHSSTHDDAVLLSSSFTRRLLVVAGMNRTGTSRQLQLSVLCVFYR